MRFSYIDINKEFNQEYLDVTKYVNYIPTSHNNISPSQIYPNYGQIILIFEF